jgi:hypothetical protein
LFVDAEIAELWPFYGTHRAKHRALLARVRALVGALRPLQMELGAVLAEMNEDYEHYLSGCASIEELGERLGLSASETRQLISAATGPRTIRERVERATVSLASAHQVCRIFRDPAFLRPGDDWPLWAESMSAKRLRELVDQRIEEVRQGEVVERPFHVLKRVSHDFDRARDLASRKAGEVLTDGTAFAVVVDHYLDDFDPLRKEAGPRRMPDTSGSPNRRVPARVALEVARRNRDRCPFLLCDNRIFLQNAHVRAFASGGNQEAANLFRPCDGHHALFDQGFVRMEGTPDEPRFSTWDGRPLDRHLPPEETDRTLDPPEEEARVDAYVKRAKERWCPPPDDASPQSPERGPPLRLVGDSLDEPTPFDDEPTADRRLERARRARRTRLLHLYFRRGPFPDLPRRRPWLRPEGPAGPGAA